VRCSIVFSIGCLFLLPGCGGGPKLVPVSGRVTLNEKPLANAYVTFAPMAGRGANASGPGSVGKTDADGRYTLRVDPSQPGAVVGRHRVMITTLGGEEAERSDGGVKLPKDKVPRRYNMETELTCDVPAEGRSDANFDLKSP
jgi:hypothetical protein